MRAKGAVDGLEGGDGLGLSATASESLHRGEDLLGVLAKHWLLVFVTLLICVSIRGRSFFLRGKNRSLSLLNDRPHVSIRKLLRDLLLIARLGLGALGLRELGGVLVDLGRLLILERCFVVGLGLTFVVSLHCWAVSQLRTIDEINNINGF